MPRKAVTNYLGTVVILALGILLLVPLLEDWLEAGAPVTDLGITKLLFPLLYFGILLGYVRWRFTRTEDTDMLRIAAWVVLGAIVTPILVGFSLVGREESIVDVLHITNRASLRGAVVFLLIDHFSANNHFIRRQLEERTDQLEFVNRLLRHDIRNDVMTITSYVEILLDHQQDDRFSDDVDLNVDPLEQIADCANHIAELAAIASRLEIESEYREQPVAVDEMFETAINRVQSEYPNAELDLATDEGRAVAVSADTALFAVFANLLRNAVQHNDQPTPRATLTAETAPDTVTVRIADNGPGLPESIRSSLFTPGVKGEESSGSGLGLYLVRTLIDRYDGDIQIEENEPRGTAFIIELNRATSVTGEVS